MPDTFATLGIPFPLFEAPVEEASDYRGAGRCGLCGAAVRHCFKVSEAAPFCTRCGPSREAGVCSGCRGPLPPPLDSPSPLLCCYPCLRAGRAAITKNTVLGMISWEQAAEGLTHGVPGLDRTEFELVPSEDDPEWLRARIGPELLFDLLRTPGYVTWQGERWQFCCGRPCVYLGEWKEKEFGRRAPNGDGLALFRQADLDGLDPDLWGSLAGIGGPYVYRCPVCGRLSGHWDMD